MATVTVTDHPRREAEALIRTRGWAGVTVEDDVLEMPAVLLGSIDGIVETLEARRERYGVSYYVVSDRARDALAPVVARLAGR